MYAAVCWDRNGCAGGGTTGEFELVYTSAGGTHVNVNVSVPGKETTLARAASGWSGCVDAAGEFQDGFRQLVGGFHGGVVADAV